MHAIVASPALDGILLEFNESRTLLEIAANVVSGSIAAGEGRADQAIRHLRTAAWMARRRMRSPGGPASVDVPFRTDPLSISFVRLPGGPGLAPTA